MTCKIKICGITNQQDLDWIARCGADYGGVLVEIDSPRGVPLDTARNLFAHSPLPMVAVTLNEPWEQLIAWMEELHPVAVQLHGHESPDTVKQLKSRWACEIWKVIHLPAWEEHESVNLDAVLSHASEYQSAGTDRFLVDATVRKEGQQHLGGTGKTVDWELAKKVKESVQLPMIVAGGIHPGNVRNAVSIVRPYAIDLSSGVELTKGNKDPDKVLDVITRVRSMVQDDRMC